MSDREPSAASPVPADDGGDGEGPQDETLRERARGEDRHLWELIRFLPDIVKLLARVVRDPRVSLRSKVMTGAVLAYVVSPVDVVPDVIPVAGQMDDLAVVMWGLRRLLRSAGYDLLRELWSGSDDGFVALLVVAGVEE